MPSTLMLAALLAQAPAVEAQNAQLDRIRQALAEPQPITIPAQATDSDAGKRVFRVRVQEWTFTGKPWDQDARAVPAYVRPTMPLAHYEFLQMVTPEEFRASTLYHPPLSVTFDPVILKKFIQERRRAAAERNAREEVRRELDTYLRARESAAR